MSLERNGWNLLTWFHYYAKTQPQYPFKNGTVDNLIAHYSKGNAATRKILLEGVGDVYEQLKASRGLFSPSADEYFKKAYKMMAEKGGGLLPEKFTPFQTTPGLVASGTPWTDTTVKFLKPVAAVGDAVLSTAGAAVKTVEVAAKGISWGANVLVPLAIAGALYFYVSQAQSLKKILKRGE